VPRASDEVRDREPHAGSLLVLGEERERRGRIHIHAAEIDELARALHIAAAMRPKRRGIFDGVNWVMTAP